MNGNKRARVECSLPSPSDHKNPDVAPKPQMTRACAECKKHKIKCFIEPGQTACKKCLRSGINCVPHNFAQKFIDDDAAWKAQATSTIERLKEAVEHLLHHNQLPALASYDENTRSGLLRSASEVGTLSCSPKAAPSASASSPTRGRGNFVSEGPSTDLRQDDSDLVPLPMNNLYNLTDPGSSKLIRVDPADANGPDFISQGVVSIAEAEFLFDHYRDHINPLLCDGILCPHKSLRGARQSSSLLVAVALTVAALHIPNREQPLHATYNAFVTLMRGSCLLRSQNLDDIRALCIGAFYLTSLSWALCSRAVRVATEMNLHKLSLQFARGGSGSAASAAAIDSHERVRLWYVLYVCDHQFALAYGRPPLMHEDAAIRNADKLLQSGLSSQGDAKLVGQVKLFRILADAYFKYGCDPDLELTGQDFEVLQSFNILVDQWRLEYQPSRHNTNNNRHNNSDHHHQPMMTTTAVRGPDLLSSTKGVTILYYHLARFQLNSPSLRGISAQGSCTTEDGSNNNISGLQHTMAWDRQEAANAAIAAASNTVRLIVDDGDLRKELIGMPIFVHAMIAVCASFLLKMAVVFGEPEATTKGGQHQNQHRLHLPRDLAKHGFNFHTMHALESVENLVRLLSAVAADNVSQRHVIRQVVTGLKELLQRFFPGPEPGTFVYLRSGAALKEPGVPVAGNPFPGNNLVSHPSETTDANGGSGSRHGSSNFHHHPLAVEMPAAGTATQGVNEGALPQQQPQLPAPWDHQPQQQDPFDLVMGDLDWRFSDSFLWGVDTSTPYM